MTARFQYEKETKNKIRFREISDSPMIETLYIRKSALSALGYQAHDTLIVTFAKEEKECFI